MKQTNLAFLFVTGILILIVAASVVIGEALMYAQSLFTDCESA